METALVFFFAFTSVVSTVAYFVELHLRIKREQELDGLLNKTTTDFSDWKRKRKEKIKNGNNRNKKSLPAKRRYV